MPKKEMTVTKKGAAFYRTRMLQAGDPIRLPNRVVQAHAAHGYVTVPADDIKALRAQYRAKFGKGPGPSWDTATLREKIAAAS
jgi:hypothetical protein